MTSRTTVVTVNSITKSFGRLTAVEDVNFSIRAGEVVGFVGVNGAGKTTTINMLLGFTSPTKGEVLLFDQQITPANAHRSHHRVGYAAGDMDLPSRMTGRQYVDFVMSQSNDNHAERLEYLTKIFSPQLDKKISTLSRGNKQKIALVAAFVTEAPLIILDEPTSGLDPIMQDAFLDLVREERERGTTVFMSSHYLQEVAEVCTRVMLMKKGRIIEDLSAGRLAAASGKTVRVVSKHKVKTVPREATNVVYDKVEAGQRVSFIYNGPTPPLQKWLGLLRDVTDFEVSERTLEAEFRSLYADGEEVRK